jgi:tetratricopeptide (TPR) repeat protein
MNRPEKIQTGRVFSASKPGAPPLSLFTQPSCYALLVLASCLALLVSMTGCQTLHPFRNSVQQKASVLREWTHSGLDAMQNGKLAQARAFFSRAATQSPQDAVARVNLARADARMGNLQEATAHLKSAIALDPDEVDLHVELGELHLKASRPNEATQSVERALSLDARSARAWGLKGKLSHAAGDFEQALSAYQRSLSYSSSLGNDNDEIQMLMADVYQQLGKPTRALSTVEQLLSRYPRDRQPESALLVKAKTLMNMDQTEPAMDILAIACARPEATLESFLRLGEAQLINGRRSQARQTLAMARQQYPDEPVLVQLAQELNTRDQTAIASKDPEPSGQLIVR